nr:hypothetical protein [Naviculales sp.]
MQSQAPIMRLDPRNTYTNVGRSGISIYGRKQDKILFLRNRELPLFIYMIDERLIRNQEFSELIKELRGGSWDLVGTAALLVLMILIFSILKPVHQGWGFDRPTPFQPSSRFPPYYGLQKHVLLIVRDHLYKDSFRDYSTFGNATSRICWSNERRERFASS